MSFQPKPKQALFIWRLISAETPEEREPMISKARPELDIRTERTPLVEHGFVRLETRVRGAKHYVLTDKAWAWAASSFDVELMKSNSRVGAVALQGLLRRLLPFLSNRRLSLAALFAEESSQAEVPPRASEPLHKRIEQTCLELTGGKRKSRVRLAALRRKLSAVPRDALDYALLDLTDVGKIALFRDDNTAALTTDDHDAALLVGNSPRHVVYLEA